jgi:hypothetical protein
MRVPLCGAAYLNDQHAAGEHDIWRGGQVGQNVVTGVAAEAQVSVVGPMFVSNTLASTAAGLPLFYMTYGLTRKWRSSRS